MKVESQHREKTFQILFYDNGGLTQHELPWLRNGWPTPTASPAKQNANKARRKAASSKVTHGSSSLSTAMAVAART
jgi:hypothetical protein